MEDNNVYLVIQKQETKGEKFVRKANTALAIGAIAAVVIPIGYSLICDGVNWIKYKYKIKKGLKDGSIIEIDGKYYEVNVDEPKSED